MGHISPALAVRDVKRTIQFYRDSLGFEMGMAFPDADNPEYADLSRDGMVIMLIPVGNAGIDSNQRLGVGVNLYMQIDGNIDEYYNLLKNKGVKVVADIKDEPFGIRDFTIEDIDGYKLTFNQVSKAVKACMSCGMPMTKPDDFGGGNPENLYCVYCSNPDGSLKSREQVFRGMVNFMMTSQKMDRETAESAVKERMARMPAWSGRI
jgi:uncharacterized glyoxalase superfamily protein PhnB